MTTLEWRWRSAVLILPVALLAFGDPLDGLGDAFFFGLGALGFGDPFGVLALAAGAEVAPDFLRGLVLFGGGGRFGGGLGGGTGGLPGALVGFGAVVNEG